MTPEAEARRLRILDEVAKQPGVSFRGLVRATGMPSGCLRHHVYMLKKQGRLYEVGTQEHRSGQDRRSFFLPTAKGRVERELLLYQAPQLRTVRDWVAQHPRSPQRAVLDAMQAHGWPRSTSQHRLTRLVDAGLVKARREGRYWRYDVEAFA